MLPQLYPPTEGNTKNHPATPNERKRRSSATTNCCVCDMSAWLNNCWLIPSVLCLLRRFAGIAPASTVQHISRHRVRVGSECVCVYMCVQTHQQHMKYICVNVLCCVYESGAKTQFMQSTWLVLLFCAPIPTMVTLPKAHMNRKHRRPYGGLALQTDRGIGTTVGVQQRVVDKQLLLIRTRTTAL